jgi:hypothetical protein
MSSAGEGPKGGLGGPGGLRRGQGEDETKINAGAGAGAGPEAASPVWKIRRWVWGVLVAWLVVVVVAVLVVGLS